MRPAADELARGPEDGTHMTLDQNQLRSGSVVVVFFAGLSGLTAIATTVLSVLAIH
jgi:hypothetical protein